MAKENALDRLNKCMEPNNEHEYTVEEQLDSISTDEFLDDMSGMAKDQISHLIEEVTIDNATSSNTESVPESSMEISEPIEPKTESNISETVDENSDKELFNDNNQHKPKRSYNKRNKSNAVESKKISSNLNDSKNPVLDQLAKDLIDSLIENHYKISRFDDDSMQMIFEYMYNKF